MSFQAMNWALNQRTGGPATKAVLLMLANYADEHGSCFPSQERIADETEQSVRSVRTHIGKLVDLGLVRVLPGGGINRATGGRWPNRYFLVLTANVAATPHATPHGLAANGGEVTGKSEGVTGNWLPTNHQEEPPSEEPPSEKTPSPAGDDARPTSGGIPLTEDVMAAMVEDAEDGHEDALFVVQASTPKAPRTSAAVDRALDEEFDGTFWPAYPRKVGKEKARLDYRRARRKGATFEDVMAGLRRFVADKADTEARFIAHASTWLNGGRWMDEPDKPAQAISGRKNGHRPYQNDDYWSTP